MAYVPVPKDLTAVKTKVMFNLTKRQLICFGSGAGIGIPLFFIPINNQLKNLIGISWVTALFLRLYDELRKIIGTLQLLKP